MSPGAAVRRGVPPPRRAPVAEWETEAVAERIAAVAPVPVASSAIGRAGSAHSTSDSPVIADGGSIPSSSSIVGAISQSDPPSRTRRPPSSPSGVT